MNVSGKNHSFSQRIQRLFYTIPQPSSIRRSFFGAALILALASGFSYQVFSQPDPTDLDQVAFQEIYYLTKESTKREFNSIKDALIEQGVNPRVLRATFHDDEIIKDLIILNSDVDYNVNKCVIKDVQSAELRYDPEGYGGLKGRADGKNEIVCSYLEKASINILPTTTDEEIREFIQQLPNSSSIQWTFPRRTKIGIETVRMQMDNSLPITIYVPSNLTIAFDEEYIASVGIIRLNQGETIEQIRNLSEIQTADWRENLAYAQELMDEYQHSMNSDQPQGTKEELAYVKGQLEFILFVLEQIPLEFRQEREVRSLQNQSMKELVELFQSENATGVSAPQKISTDELLITNADSKIVGQDANHKVILLPKGKDGQLREETKITYVKDSLSSSLPVFIYEGTQFTDFEELKRQVDLRRISIIEIYSGTAALDKFQVETEGNVYHFVPIETPLEETETQEKATNKKPKLFIIDGLPYLTLSLESIGISKEKITSRTFVEESSSPLKRIEITTQENFVNHPLVPTYQIGEEFFSPSEIQSAALSLDDILAVGMEQKQVKGMEQTVVQIATTDDERLLKKLMRQRKKSIESYLKASASPNPFNDDTGITFSVILGQKSLVSINIIAMDGSVIETIVEEKEYGKGKHAFVWHPNANVPSGTYLIHYKTSIGEWKSSKIVYRKE